MNYKKLGVIRVGEWGRGPDTHGEIEDAWLMGIPGQRPVDSVVSARRTGCFGKAGTNRVVGLTVPFQEV